MASHKSIPRISEPRFIGSARELARDRLGLLRRVAHECGDIGLFHAWGRPIVFLNKAEYVHAVLNEHAGDFDLPPLPPAARATLGVGPFMVRSRGRNHQPLRRIMFPAVQPRAVAALAGVMLDNAKRVEETWQHGQTISIQQESERITAGIAGEAFLGVSLQSHAGQLGEIVASLTGLLQTEMGQALPLPTWVPTLHNRRVRHAVRRLDAIIGGTIKRRRQNGENGEARSDLLSMLLSARYENGQPLTYEDVRDHATIMVLSGYDEMALSLTWSWWLLAMNPIVYDRLIKEVDAVLQGRRPAVEDLPRLPLALQVFKEAVRLYGPADILKPRIALRDVEVDGYCIRRGMRVIVSPHILHRKPEYFPDPERFDPERFAPENEKCLPRCAYFPFGGGQHACMGKHLALMEGHLLLTAITQRVRFDLAERNDVGTRAVYTLRPRSDIRMIVHRRETQPPT